MFKKVELTPEWVLGKLPQTSSLDGEGNISVYTACSTDANWIELALDSLDITYEAYDYVDEYDDFVFGFDFRIEDIKDECPNFCKDMKALDTNNTIQKNLLKIM